MSVSDVEIECFRNNFFQKKKKKKRKQWQIEVMTYENGVKHERLK